MAVRAWGTGRKDYSTKTELSTVPVIRSHQERFVSYVTIDWPPGLNGLGIPWPPVNVYWFNFRISATTNTLLGVFIQLEYPTGPIVARKFGYGTVEIKFPQGVIQEKNTLLAIFIYNYHSETTTIRHYASGLGERLVVSGLRV